MYAIMKCKQGVSQDVNVKQWKNNKETNRKHKEFVSRFEPPLYVPAFTTVKDFTKSTEEITRGLHKTGVPNSHQSNLYTTGIST